MAYAYQRALPLVPANFTTAADTRNAENVVVFRGAELSLGASDVQVMMEQLRCRLVANAELWPKLGDDGLREAAYRGG